MATPPYSIDTSDPTSTTAIASYPANEQANRNTINSWLLGISDATTGYAELKGARKKEGKGREGREQRKRLGW